MCHILPFYHIFYLICALCITIIICFVSNDKIQIFDQSVMSHERHIVSPITPLFVQKHVQANIK